MPVPAVTQAVTGCASYFSYGSNPDHTSSTDGNLGNHWRFT